MVILILEGLEALVAPQNLRVEVAGVLLLEEVVGEVLLLCQVEEVEAEVLRQGAEEGVVLLQGAVVVEADLLVPLEVGVVEVNLNLLVVVVVVEVLQEVEGVVEELQ